jgi:hypothetical protein
MTKEDIKTIIDIVHKTIYGFFDACGDDEETPMIDKDKLLLKINKAICINIKALEQDKANDILGAIIAEINQSINDNPKYKNDYTQGINDGLCHALHIIVKHRDSKNEIID